MNRPTLVGYVLTFNEADKVGRAITSLQQVTRDVVVVDSESTDATCRIAGELDADVVVHPFEGFSAQRNWALDYISRRYDPEYVLALDADELLSPELIADLRARMSDGHLLDDAYLVRRRVQFDGKALRWGGFANTWLPRLFKITVGRYEDRPVNEHLSLGPSATIGRLRGDLINADVTSWYEHIDKHNRYSTLEARARVEVRTGLATKTKMIEALRRPYLRRRWIRQNIWDRLPARPALRFIQVYVAAGGLLDGRPGFRRALFEAWQEMCTDLKAEELERTPCL
jgi:glycosyltransferase involved in cell wall biosynthesis